jgi:hypothetical protein
VKELTAKAQRSFPPIPDRSCDWSALVDGEEKTTTRTRPTPCEALISPAERTDESITRERKEQTHG